MIWLRNQSKPLGVIGYNDLIGAFVVEAARRAGYSVPEDVAVLGVDDDDVICGCSNPPLASIDLDPERTGYEAARMLDQLMHGAEPPVQKILMPPRGIIERPSVDTLAYDDADVTMALRFIRANSANQIGPEDVVTSVGISRTGLETKFRRHLRRSVDAEIWRFRLEQAKRLLVQTDWSLARVSEQSGFSTLAHMCRKIRCDTGKTPQQLRRERVLD
jgi:LacI family transcriptional regulator